MTERFEFHYLPVRVERERDDLGDSAAQRRGKGVHAPGRVGM